jgi:hypothetical protein
LQHDELIGIYKGEPSAAGAQEGWQQQQQQQQLE